MAAPGPSIPVDDLPMPLLCWAADGTITQANAGACSMLRSERDALVGARLVDFLPSAGAAVAAGEAMELVQRGLQGARADGQAFEVDMFVRQAGDSGCATALLVDTSFVRKAQAEDWVRGRRTANRSRGSSGDLGQMLLFGAVREGDVDVLERLLSSGADAESTDASGQSLLGVAIAEGQDAVVEVLLRHGADANRRDEAGGVPLSHAVHFCRRRASALLFDAGARIPDEMQASYAVRLCTAVQDGATERLRTLLTAGARVGARTSDGRTALHVAAACGNAEAAEMLIAHGAEVNAIDHFQNTPLALAEGALGQVLLDHGADAALSSGGGGEVSAEGRQHFFTQLRAGDLSALEQLIASGFSVDITERRDNRCALQVASAEGLRHVVDWLLARGADVNLEDRFGGNALSTAMHFNQHELVGVLLAAGAAVPPELADLMPRSLLRAARRGDSAKVRTLLAAAVALEGTDKSGRTALHLAASNGHVEIVRLLADAGADVNHSDNFMATPLADAQLNHHNDVVAVLQSMGAQTELPAPPHEQQQEAAAELSPPAEALASPRPCSAEAASGPGVRFGSYLTGKELGRGATAIVRKCVNVLSGDAFACKIIDMSRFRMLTDATRRIGAIRREAELMREMAHPNIVNLTEVCESTACGVLYLVFELVGGGDLFDRILLKRQLPEREAAAVFYQIMQALRYIHARNVLHRDVKPENILLKCDPGRQQIYAVKLGDFGAAKATAATMGHTMVGTPQFMAPEVLPGSSGNYGPEVDMFSAGALLFVMLAGQYPFEETDLHELARTVRAEDFSFSSRRWNTVSTAAKDVVCGLLCGDPALRYDVDQVLESKWMRKWTPEIEAKLARLRGSSEDACVPVPRAEWSPNRPTCELCEGRFSAISRRHHCRLCGRCVCSECSAQNRKIEGVMSRVCDECTFAM